MDNERQKLLEVIDKNKPQLTCISSMHGCTTLNDIDECIPGETFIEKAKHLAEQIAGRAYNSKALEVHVPGDIASALIVSGSLIVPHDENMRTNCCGYLMRIPVPVFLEPGAASIKFYG